MRCFLLSSLIVLTIGLSSKGENKPPPEGLQLLVQKVGPDPLPYQAVRLRLTLRNDGKKEVADLLLPEGTSILTGIKGPKDADFLSTGLKGRRGGVGLLPRSRSDFRNHDLVFETQRLTLKPGEQDSVVGAFVRPASPDELALLLQPGEHTLRLEYWQKYSASFDLKPATVQVKVAEPKGADAEVCKLLDKLRATKRDVVDSFMAAIYYRDCPEAETVPFLESIVTKYPKSSYADYARLILAHHHLEGQDPDGKQKKDIPKADIDAAVAYLNAINVKDFPYAADALLFLRTIHRWRTGDQRQVGQIEARLAAEFPEDVAWIVAQSDRLFLSKLIEDRKLAPINRGPRNPK